MTELLPRLQAQVARGFASGSEIHEGAAFRVHIWPDADVFYRNRALVTRRPGDWATAIDEMTAMFAAARRVPRLEFFAELWPDLPAALDAAGWTCEMRAPVLALPAQELREAPGRPDTVILDRDVPRDLARDFIRAAEAVFDMPPGLEGDGEFGVLLRDLALGRVLSAASLAAGRPVAGASLIGLGAEAELAGVWTLPAARRQGRGLAVCHALLGRFFDGGGEIAWLSAGDGAAERLYRRLGFVSAGTQLNYARLEAWT